MRVSRLVLAAALAPLAAPVGLYLQGVIQTESFYFPIFSVVGLSGLVVSYLGLLLIGLPCFLVIKKLGLLNLPLLGLVGILAGVIVYFVFISLLFSSPSQALSSFDISSFLLGGLLGFSVALIFGVMAGVSLRGNIGNQTYIAAAGLISTLICVTLFIQYQFGPESKFTQIFMGFNARDSYGPGIFGSETAVRNSWLKDALKDDELNHLLGQVDFEYQLLVSLSAGKRANTSGNIFIRSVDYDERINTLSVSGRVGVNTSPCEGYESDLFPFALAVVERPAVEFHEGGYYLSNFRDDCRQRKQAEP